MSLSAIHFRIGIHWQWWRVMGILSQSSICWKVQTPIQILCKILRYKPIWNEGHTKNSITWASWKTAFVQQSTIIKCLNMFCQWLTFVLCSDSEYNWNLWSMHASAKVNDSMFVNPMTLNLVLILTLFFYGCIIFAWHFISLFYWS